MARNETAQDSSMQPRDTAAFEVREALAEPGCAVCRLASRSVGRLIQSVAYDQVNDLAVRADLRASRGFCNQHAYRWLREAHNVLGTAIIYRELILAALDDLDAGAPRGGLLRAFRGAENASVCVACRTQHQAEKRYLEALLAALAHDASAVDAFKASDGLCRRHTAAALRRGGAGAASVVDQTRAAMRHLLHNLDEVIRKEDYRFRGEPRSDDERTAPPRAIAWVAGLEGLVEN
jgi:hypothetical protein